MLHGPARNPRRRRGNRGNDDQRQAHFTRLEYLEFTSAAEFRKFKGLPPISQKTIDAVDWPRLCHQLGGL